MKSPEHAFGGAGLVILYKLRGKPCLFHIFPVICLYKIPTGISVDCGSDDAQSFDAAHIFFYCNLSHFFLFSNAIAALHLYFLKIKIL